MAVNHEDDEMADEMADETNAPRSFLARLEQWGIGFLYSFLERDASNRWFWIRVTLAMLIVTGGPAVAIALYFYARGLGYFE